MSATQQTLFRPQSLRARELAWLGRPSLTLGLPVTLSTIASVLAAVATAALVTFGAYTRRVDLHGIMLPSNGLIAISAATGGRIENLAVHEGDVVRERALLYTVDLDTTTKTGSTQQAIIKALNEERATVLAELERKQQLNAETEKDLRRKVDNFKVQIAQLTNQMAMQTGSSAV